MIFFLFFNCLIDFISFTKKILKYKIIQCFVHWQAWTPWFKWNVILEQKTIIKLAIIQKHKTHYHYHHHHHHYHYHHFGIFIFWFVIIKHHQCVTLTITLIEICSVFFFFWVILCNSPKTSCGTITNTLQSKCLLHYLI